MAAAMLNGVLAANLSISDTNFQLKADSVATDHNGLGLVATSVNRKSGAAGVAQIGIKKATLSNLCASTYQSLGGLGGFNVKISIPAVGATANNLQLNATSLGSNSATLGGTPAAPIILGQDASAVNADQGTTGTAGQFGLETGNVAGTAADDAALSSTLTGLNGIAQSATIGGALTLPSGAVSALSISVSPQATNGATNC
jgi:hypothetical protein